MDQATQAKLRAPFDAALIGKLPRVWCRACRDDRSKVCDRHRKSRCDTCGNNITDAHLHLDYVGHAETTDRLIQVDSEWTWEPVAFGTDGLPLLDRHGGLWIRLTVAGVTRLGYGHAEGKNGPDAVKEAIGDAIRNAAMRFGVALDLWGAKFKEAEPEHDDAEDEAKTAQAYRDRALEPHTTFDEIRALYAEVSARSLLYTPVVDEHGVTVQLGSLIKRIGDELAGTTP